MEYFERRTATVIHRYFDCHLPDLVAALHKYIAEQAAADQEVADRVARYEATVKDAVPSERNAESFKELRKMMDKDKAIHIAMSDMRWTLLTVPKRTFECGYWVAKFAFMKTEQGHRPTEGGQQPTDLLPEGRRLLDTGDDVGTSVHRFSFEASTARALWAMTDPSCQSRGCKVVKTRL